MKKEWTDEEIKESYLIEKNNNFLNKYQKYTLLLERFNIESNFFANHIENLNNNNAESLKKELKKYYEKQISFLNSQYADEVLQYFIDDIKECNDQILKDEIEIKEILRKKYL